MIAGIKSSKALKDALSISQSSWGRSSTDSSLPEYLNLKQHCGCYKTGNILVGRGFLTAEMVDTLESMQKDWIIELDSEQILNLQNGEVKQFGFEQVLFEQKQLTTANLIAKIPSTSFEALEVNRETCWFVTRCWSIGGWGRVRFVIRSKTPIYKKSISLLVTNRLDWSPSRIIGIFSQATRPLKDI